MPDSERKKLIQQQLVLLLHAHKCRQREDQSNGEVRQCLLPHCRTMKHVLIHITTCRAGQACPVPHCSSSVKIISHCKNCTKYDCPVCLPFRQARDRQQQAAATVQTNETSQGLATADMKRVYAALGLPFNAAGNLQSEVRPGNGGLINPPPVLPGSLPDNPATVKDWHQSVTQDLRHHLVQKIVQAIFPTSEILTRQDYRMLSIVAYACKVEGDMYRAANSREEYYQLLAEKIYKILKELEEKRQKRMEMKLQQIQQNLGPIIGGNSGTSSPNVCTQTENLEIEVLTEMLNNLGIISPY